MEQFLYVLNHNHTLANAESLVILLRLLVFGL